jgi:hypothetical protein
MKKISIALVLLAVFAAGANATQAIKWISVFDAIKTVQEDASIEYHTKGGLAQRLDIPPGVYKISVQRLR